MIIKKYADLFIQIIKETYDKKGLRATGRFAESLDAQTKSDNFIINGVSYSKDLVQGFDSKHTSSASILQWIKVKKGLPSEFYKRPEKFAYLISRKHKKEGRKVPNQFNDGRLLDDSLAEFERRHLPKLLEERGQLFVEELTAVIKNNLAV